MILTVYKNVQIDQYEIEVEFKANLIYECIEYPYWDKSLYNEKENEQINKVCDSQELFFEFETIVIF